MLGFFRKNNIDGEWHTVAELKVGQQIAVPKEDVLNAHSAGKIDSREWIGENDVVWDEIESIEYMGTEQVWDIEVEGTHNFVGNNIFAHNTYITGNIGAGTSTPYAKLSAADDGTSTTLIGADALSGFTGNLIELKLASTTKFSVSGTGFATTTVSGLNISGSATSTSNVGFDITTGCFSISGTCVGGGSFTNTLAGGGTATTTFYNGGIVFSDSTKLTQSATPANFFWDETNKRLGLGTSTPFAKLSVNSIAGEPAFVIGSSTATSFIVNASGNVGIGNTNPSFTLQVGSSATQYFAFNGGAGLNVTVARRDSNSTSGNNILTLENRAVSAANNYATIQFLMNSSAGTGIEAGAIKVISGGAWNSGASRDSDMAFFTTLDQTSSEKLRITSSGRVGIATSTDLNATLTLQGAAGLDILRVASSTSGSNILTVSEWGGFSQNISSTTALNIQDGSGNSVFTVNTATTTGAGIDITATGSQTANLLSMYASDGTTLFSGFNKVGGLIIGTSSASTKFAIATSTASYDSTIEIMYASAGATTTIGFFTSTTTGLTAGLGMALPSALTNYMIVGNGKVQAGMAIVNGGLCIDNDGWCTASTTGRISSVTSTTGGSDVAEMYNSTDALEPGDVVAITDTRNFVKIAQKGEPVLGIVSTEPGVILGLQPDDNSTKGIVEDVETDGEKAVTSIVVNEKTVDKYPVALAGRVPVKISIENGEIKAGDYLTLSSTIQGVAVKAIEAGEVLGQALENYSDTKTGKILIFVKNTYYAGVLKDDPLGQGLQGSSFGAGDGVATFSGLFADQGLGQTILKFLEEVGLKIVNGIAYVKNLFVEKLTVGTSNKPAGITLYDENTGEPYCLKIVNGAMLSALGECGIMVAEPVASSTDPIIIPTDPTATSTEPVVTSTDPVATDTTATKEQNSVEPPATEAETIPPTVSEPTSETPPTVEPPIPTAEPVATP